MNAFAKNAARAVLVVIVVCVMSTPIAANPLFVEDFESGLDPATWELSFPGGQGHKEIVPRGSPPGGQALFMRGADLSPPATNGVSRIRSRTAWSAASARVDFEFSGIALQQGSGGDGRVRIRLWDDAQVEIAYVYEELNLGNSRVGIAFAGDTVVVQDDVVKLADLTGWHTLSIGYTAGAMSTIELFLDGAAEPFFARTTNQDLGLLGAIEFEAGGQFTNTGEWNIDNIVVTPEPATLSLLLLGGLGVLRRRR